MLSNVTLNDKYTQNTGRIFVTGIQALVRLPLAQWHIDRSRGLNTAGYISGYRGSPLGGFDMQLWQAKEYLDEHNIVFQPGINEDLAATAIWGTQQAELNGEGKFDGVFGIWYGKGPGVDRSGDAFRHANLAGTSKYGGVLALMGDDHACESSTTAHQSEFALVDAMMPILNPSSVQDILDFGLMGWQLSRYSGCWVGLKCVHDTVEATASIDIDSTLAVTSVPDSFDMPAGGLNIRWPDTPLQQEQRLHELKLPAVQAFWRANSLDRVIFESAQDSIGIVTTGKSYSDVRRALVELGIEPESAKKFGLRLYKVALSWPLEREGLRRFARGLKKIIVVEEKRSLIEDQIKTTLYGGSGQPSVVGKLDENGEWLLPSTARLSAVQIASVIGNELIKTVQSDELSARVDQLRQRLKQETEMAPMQRMPYFCAGCPHNTSTKVPQGSIALAGIGCHYMAQWMDRSTARYTQMGGEGASWIGESQFSKRQHVFQNIGDGTYLHSGLLAVRAAVAAKTTMTFKLLYNDAVAMTGGQPFDGPLSVSQIARQLLAEGVHHVSVVTDDVDRCRSQNRLPEGVEVSDRHELDGIQRQLREMKGVTAIIYDQTCAAEKRRRRKRGEYPDPPKRVFIHPEICEGCGDCGVQSNCVAILPHETEFGRKRRIDQSACNKDYSCTDGFCPSFVTVNGGRLNVPSEAPESTEFDASLLPSVELPPIDREYCIVLNGVGGTGVITIGAVLGMAAHLAELGCSVLDMIGLAQKGGAVMSNLIIADKPEDISTMHVAHGGADLILGGDLVVSAGEKVLGTASYGRTHAVINSYELMSGDFTRIRDMEFPAARLKRIIAKTVGDGHVTYVNANDYAETLFGNTIAANFFMIGIAYQMGLLPIPGEAIAKAIELNGRSVQMNKTAFNRGRQFVADPSAVDRLVDERRGGRKESGGQKPATFEKLVEHRSLLLTQYQDQRYARKYREFVERVDEAEQHQAPGMSGVADGVARFYYKLLAYKDEYEVARLLSSSEFTDRLASEFTGNYTLQYHLAPPLLARRDKVTNLPLKRTFGPWMRMLLRITAKFKFLRGTLFDPFRWSNDRKIERDLIVRYESIVSEVVSKLNSDNHRIAREVVSFPESIRGFGHVKHKSCEETLNRLDELMKSFRDESSRPEAA